MKKSIVMAAAAMLTLAACNQKKEMENNPFFSSWDTPYEIPDFGRIKTTHYMPAFEEGMARQKA